MGYTGYVVLARSNGRLDELRCIEDLLVAVSDNLFDGGWRLGFLGPCDDEVSTEELVEALANETGAPAIAIYVLDSDFALASSARMDGLGCSFYLDEKTALGELADFDGIEPLNEAALPALLGWAAEAGFTPDRDRLAAAMEVSPGPFGDGIEGFAEALGLTRIPA